MLWICFWWCSRFQIAEEGNILPYGRKAQTVHLHHENVLHHHTQEVIKIVSDFNKLAETTTLKTLKVNDRGLLHHLSASLSEECRAPNQCKLISIKHVSLSGDRNNWMAGRETS